MTVLETIALGCAGGALPDILRIIKGRYEQVPGYLGSWYFWLGLGLLLMVGGVVAYLAEPARVIDALAIGFSAPTMLSKFLGEQNPPAHFNIIDMPGPGSFDGPRDFSLSIPNLAAPIQRWWAN